MESPILALAMLGALAFACINLAAFAAFGIDKRCAEAGQWRISEATLLLLAFLGGSPRAYAGRHLFRHKTRKQPFSNSLFNIVVLQLAAIAGSCAWVMSG